MFENFGHRNSHGIKLGERGGLWFAWLKETNWSGHISCKTRYIQNFLSRMPPNDIMWSSDEAEFHLSGTDTAQEIFQDIAAILLRRYSTLRGALTRRQLLTNNSFTSVEMKKKTCWRLFNGCPHCRVIFVFSRIFGKSKCLSYFLYFFNPHYVFVSM